MIDHTNYLFILANQGAGGHRLGRLISTINSVYWYSSEKNGITPDETFLDNSPNRALGKDISEYHYDRLVGEETVPLVGERIEVWWDSSDIDFYYKSVWAPRMFKFSSILDTQILHWVLHDTPTKLLNRFTNAKIISLIDTDINNVADRYLKTTAKFPAYYRLPGLKPEYKNQYAQDVCSLEKKKLGATLQDLWEYQNPGQNYLQFVENKLRIDNNQRIKVDHPRHLKITWGDLDLTKISNFISN